MGSCRGVKCDYLNCDVTVLWATHILNPENCIYFFLFQSCLGRCRSCPTILSLKLFFLMLLTKDQTKVTGLLCLSVPVHVLSHHLPFLLYCTLFLSYDTPLYCSSSEPLPFLSSYSSVILGHSRLHDKTHQSLSAESSPFYLQLTQSPCSALAAKITCIH